MSIKWNQLRHTRNADKPFIPYIVDPRVIWADIEGDRELRDEQRKAQAEAEAHAEVEAVMQLVDAYRASVEAEQAERRAAKREGKGVAWVAHLKYEVQSEMPPVIRKTRKWVLNTTTYVV